MKTIGFFCSQPLYKYNGYTFEFGYMTGPWPVRKDGELYKRAGDKFYDAISGFLKMSEDERGKYLIDGGCEPIVRREA